MSQRMSLSGRIVLIGADAWKERAARSGKAKQGWLEHGRNVIAAAFSKPDFGV
jgi:hypothetical protein